MRSALLVLGAFLGSCAQHSAGEPTATLVNDKDLAYLLTHAKIESESPLPHLLPPGSKHSYRILAFTQQGNCVNGCPASTLYVATWNYQDYPDGRIRLCRIDGVRFYSDVSVKSYRPAQVEGDFLAFEVRSNPEPRSWRRFEIRVSADACSIKLTEEHKDGA